jgi:hypothetical protein
MNAPDYHGVWGRRHHHRRNTVISAMGAGRRLEIWTVAAKEWEVELISQMELQIAE